MSEERKFKPLIKLAGLYENQSQRSGETYFAGYLGSAKVVVLRDKNAEPGKPGWSLCIQERDPKPEQGQGNGGYGQGQSQGHGYGQSQGYGQGQRQGGYGHDRQPTPPRQATSAPLPLNNQQGGGMDDDDIPF
ncbi:MAG: hypothetical protein HQL80_07035 [Magnetococcales bacterium]|nr:hypothetical protein [Magnetococcales bacterium]MBF0583974.1 hypothetical protein [Magnetococcales bacterium]